MLRSSESRVPKILTQNALKPNKMNSNFYLNKAKECFKNNNYPDAYENFVNYFDSLDDPGSSTPAVQLGFTKLVCRIGIVLEEANDTEELLKIYLQAINFFPNNYIILNNLGGYLFKMGQIDIARTYLDKAVACSKKYLPAEKNLMHCKWRQIPRWHFKMLNDIHRNSAYYQAIRSVISKGYRDVIDLGAGCGLLSLMASEHPEVNVTAIEENKSLAKMCENIMKENHRSNVKVINCFSTKLSEPPARCNLLVTEIFDCAIFGERMLETLLHAHHMLITEKDFKVVPCGARLYASAISYKDPQNFRVVNPITALSLDQMCIRQIDAEPYEAEDISTKNIVYLSQPVEVFDLNFYDVLELNVIANDLNFSKIIEFECLQDDQFTSIAMWFELDLDENITITTDPRCQDRVQCWEQAVCHLVHPIAVKKGEIVQFEVTVLDSQLKFYQITKPDTCISCWLVSKEIVSFLNDTYLVNQILALANEFMTTGFAENFKEPHKPVMDLMSFPLLGFMLAAAQGCQFYGIAVIFNIVSLATEQWIRGEATWVNATTDINYVYYGLFQGNYQRNAPFSITYKLTATCSFQHNICAMLCGADSSATATLLDNLYNNNISTSYSMDNCPTVLKFTYNYKSFENLPSSLRTDTVNYVTSKHFINAGVWLSTLLFLILAIVAGLVSTTLALYNTVDNPTEFFLSVKSLFIYNATGFGCTLLSMILWGTMYNLLIFHNVAIYDTIVGSITSDKTVFLGYSYWIGFISLTFYAASTAILYYREYLNERDPRNQKIGLDADSADANLYLY